MTILTLFGESIVAGSEDWLEKLLNNSFDLFAVPTRKGKLEKILKKIFELSPVHGVKGRLEKRF
jgi:hypothetical protein